MCLAHFFGLKICCLETNEIAIDLQGRMFRAGDLIRSILLMCGGNFNEFYCRAQKMAIADVLYLFEQWLELQEKLHPKKGK